MLISLNWLSDFVDIPTGTDPRELAQRFTITTAEVEGVEQVRHTVGVQAFDDWIIEVDNKSITHRPDCWGHYGIAREVAAMLSLPLRPYDVTPLAELQNKLAAIPIEIDDPAKCPRYSAMLMKGLKAQPSPPWMQARLTNCGMRPIDLIVDLTNYIMLELGQPMHAFDGGKLSNIQVATAAKGEKFTTLDGVTRSLPEGTLMIQSNRRSVAIAGIMGGASTEVGPSTQSVLLESANFDAPTIRRAATAMGHRTEASARFEKSLDPANTLLGIQRFHKLAKAELPGLTLAGTISDCYPGPKQIKRIALDIAFASRIVGQEVAPERITQILSALSFDVQKKNGTMLVTPPSWRATKDIAIEADVIEEIARFVGYNNIQPAMPTVTTRYFEPSSELAMEERTLNYLCVGGEFAEVHGYIWYDDDWIKTLGYDPGECITLKNPAADNCSRLRQTLVPGLLAMAERNRHHFARFQLAEIGSVFHPGKKDVESSQHRSLGLIVAEAGKKADQSVWDRLRSALDGWARQVLESDIVCKETKPQYSWEDAGRLAEIQIGGETIGRITLVPLASRQRIDERLKAWSVALAELNLSRIAPRLGRHDKLPIVPRFPQAQLDFSVLADADSRFAALRERLGVFRHDLLRGISFVESYQGGSIAAGKRGLTLRAEIGHPDRTLTDDEIQQFSAAFKAHFTSLGLAMRA
jgi:phenylalanyl-tRNA synthetase beta chain